MTTFKTSGIHFPCQPMTQPQPTQPLAETSPESSAVDCNALASVTTSKASTTTPASKSVLRQAESLADSCMLEDAVADGDVKCYEVAGLADYLELKNRWIVPKGTPIPEGGQTFRIFCGQLGPTSRIQYLVLDLLGHFSQTKLYNVKEKGRNCRTFTVVGIEARDRVLSWSRGLRSTDSCVYVGVTPYGRKVASEMSTNKTGPEHPVTIELEHNERQREEHRSKKTRKATANGFSSASSSASSTSSSSSKGKGAITCATTAPAYQSKAQPVQHQSGGVAPSPAPQYHAPTPTNVAAPFPFGSLPVPHPTMPVQQPPLFQYQVAPQPHGFPFVVDQRTISPSFDMGHQHQGPRRQVVPPATPSPSSTFMMGASPELDLHSIQATLQDLAVC